MFEKQWGVIVEDIDVEGWRLIITSSYRNGKPHYGWILTGHNVCNGKTNSNYRDGEYSHKCMKCGIWCPPHVREYLLSIADAHHRGFPV